MKANVSDGSAPLYRQIYWRVRQSIASGRLKAGDRVPSVRALASELSLARGTVETAYQMLISEGYLVARGPAGTVVSPSLKPALASAHLRDDVAQQHSLIQSGEKPLPLQMGLPALDAFPGKLWNRLANQTMRNTQWEALICPDARGHSALRSAVSRYLGISRGVDCSPEQLFIVAGYRACLDLICRSLLVQEDRCWIEDPGYFATRNFLRESGATLVPVPVDENGMVVETAINKAADARFAVVTPAHQSPLCTTLSMPRRHALLEWASKQESWIIEDDYDGEYRYYSRPLPALKSLDAFGRVLYCGTFSKVLFPGLRLSYLVVPEKLVPRFTEIADTMQSHCPYLWQVTTARFLEEGHFGRHLNKMRILYANRRQLLVQALRASLGHKLLIDDQAGGMHLVTRLIQGTNDREIAARAMAVGLRVHALSNWYHSSTVEYGLLLGFTNVSSKECAMELTGRLAQVFPE